MLGGSWWPMLCKPHRVCWSVDDTIRDLGAAGPENSWQGPCLLSLQRVKLWALHLEVFPTGSPAVTEPALWFALIVDLCFYKSYQILILRDVSCVVSRLAHSTARVLRLRQTTLESLAHRFWDNRTVSDYLSNEQGNVCAVASSSWFGPWGT